VVEELRSAGVAQLDDGAVCVFVEGQSVPLIVQKSDGGFGYASTDMAAIKQRLFDEKAEWVIYVTGAARGRRAQGWQTGGDGLPPLSWKPYEALLGTAAER
jgi:arginyl-tRNA synthetase